MAPSADPEHAPEPTPSARKPGRFWQVFWLTFLVASLAYAWHSFYVPSNHIDWAKDYAAAQQRAVASDRPMILFFTGEWCVPCRIMKREVWADEQVTDVVNAGFIPVLIDVDAADAAAALQRYAIGATPTTIVTDAQGQVLEQRRGGLNKAEFLGLLGSVGPSAAGSDEG